MVGCRRSPSPRGQPGGANLAAGTRRGGEASGGMTTSSEAAALARLVLALREFRRDIVLVGGWAHRLSRLHPLSNTAVTFEPLFSEDADMVLPSNLMSEGEDLGES